MQTLITAYMRERVDARERLREDFKTKYRLKDEDFKTKYGLTDVAYLNRALPEWKYVNDQGHTVTLDPEKDKYYCGQDVGDSNLPGSAGHCGPNNGPQCQSCLRFQSSPIPLAEGIKDMDEIGTMFDVLSYAPE